MGGDGRGGGAGHCARSILGTGGGVVEQNVKDWEYGGGEEQYTLKLF
jgi:hypothetical protein